jgi:hypothetical protein
MFGISECIIVNAVILGKKLIASKTGAKSDG